MVENGLSPVARGYYVKQIRVVMLAMAALTVAIPMLSSSAPAQAQASNAAPAGFREYLESVRIRAANEGVTAATLERVIQIGRASCRERVLLMV